MQDDKLEGLDIEEIQNIVWVVAKGVVVAAGLILLYYGISLLYLFFGRWIF